MSDRGFNDRTEAALVFGVRWTLVVLAFLALEVAISLDLVSQFVIPTPSTTLVATYHLIVGGEALRYLAITMGEVLTVLLGLILVGVPFGFVVARKTILWDAWGTGVAALSAAPVVLLYPLFLVVFGRNVLTVIMIALVTALPPVILKTVEGVQGVKRTLINVGSSLRMTERQHIRMIILPAALPDILLGLRLGLIYSLITIVAVEYLIALGGLGRLVAEFAESYELGSTYGTVLLVVVVSIIFFVILERIEQWLTRTA